MNDAVAVVDENRCTAWNASQLELSVVIIQIYKRQSSCAGCRCERNLRLEIFTHRAFVAEQNGSLTGNRVLLFKRVAIRIRAITLNGRLKCDGYWNDLHEARDSVPHRLRASCGMLSY